MLSWVNVNFNVLINSEDESNLESLICDFVDELYEYNGSSHGIYIELENPITTIGGVSSVKFERNYKE
jgi:hypothetical protein